MKITVVLFWMNLIFTINPITTVFIKTDEDIFVHLVDFLSIAILPKSLDFYFS